MMEKVLYGYCYLGDVSKAEEVLWKMNFLLSGSSSPHGEDEDGKDGAAIVTIMDLPQTRHYQ